MKFLRICIVIQLVLGTIWTLTLITSANQGLGPIVMFVLIYPIHGVFGLIAAWSWWKKPQKRRLASVVLLLPVGFLFLPSLIVAVFGGAVLTGPGDVGRTVVLLIAAGIGACLLFPAKAAGFVPDFCFRSRVFNVAALAALVLAWTPVVTGLVWLLLVAEPIQAGDRSNSGLAALYVSGIAMLFMAAIGLVSVWTFLLGYIGVNQPAEVIHRSLHKAQLAGSAPGLLMLAMLVLAA